MGRTQLGLSSASAVTTDADKTIVVEGVDVESRYYLAQSTLNRCEPSCVALRREVKCPGVSSSPTRATAATS